MRHELEDAAAESSGGDAADAADADAHSAVTRCDPLAPFSEPMPLPGLATSADELVGSLSPDELTIYYCRPGGSTVSDIAVATRADMLGGFGSPRVLPHVNTDMTEELDPWITPDGLTLLLATDPGGLPDIYMTTRATDQADFEPPTAVSGIQDPGTDRTPSMSVDGQELWFTSDRTGGPGGFDVWRAIKSGASFANPVAVVEVSSTSTDGNPVLSADKLTLYISSKRPGRGGFDIWRSSRRSTSEKFGTPEPVIELNTGSDELATWLSPDSCRIYLHSGRNGTSDVFVATRSPP